MPDIEFRTGWAKEDEDFQFLATPTAPSFSAPADFVPPTSMSFRGILTVENQGNMGSCVGHGGSSGLEMLEYLSNRGRIQMSRMAMYLLAQRSTGITGDRGATIAGCIKAMAATGCPEESVFPYPQQYSRNLPASALTAADKHKILGHQELRSYEEVFDWISQAKGPVVFGMDFYTAVSRCTGKITTDMLGGHSLGGHCMVFAGYSGDKDSNGDYLIDNLNSHGTGWGDQGWAQWTPDAINALCRQEQGQSSVIGITDITGFDSTRIINIQAIV